MITRTGNQGFFAAHYDWVLAGIGALALVGAGVFYALTLGADADEAASRAVAEVDRMRPQETGVKALDMTAYRAAMRSTRNPVTVAEISEKSESFLASERRVTCKKCRKAISGDIKKFPACPYCGEKQEGEKKVVLDGDGDGLPDEWELRIGLNPNDASDAAADKDGDGFTNLEEFKAKTDIADAKDHPDYLDSLKIAPPLKPTYMPFVFTEAMKIPSGWRLKFFDASKRNDYGQMGREVTAVIGEEIGKYGFVIKGYEKKQVRQAIKGGKGMQKMVDISEATLERKRDGKQVKLVIARKRSEKPAAIDLQATLVYERGTVQNFEVVPGSEIDLNGSKYKIADIKAEGKGAKVVVENSLSGKKRILEALEQ
jgi:hypothetical protein